MGYRTRPDPHRRAGAAAVATPRPGGSRLPRPIPDHRPGTARHPAREHSAESRPRPRRNRAPDPGPPDHPRRAPAPRRPGDAAPRPVIAGRKERSLAPSNGMMRDPLKLPTGYSDRSGGP